MRERIHQFRVTETVDNPVHRPSPESLILDASLLSSAHSFCLSLCLWCLASAGAQQHSAPVQNDLSRSFATAANRWQLAAGDEVPRNDLVGPSVRAERDRYWAEAMQRYRRIPNGSGVTVGGGSYFADAPEIDAAQGTTFVVARFDSFEIFDAVKGEYLPYTEMSFTIRSIVAMSTPSLFEGDVISVDIPGGRIKTLEGVMDFAPA